MNVFQWILQQLATKQAQQAFDQVLSQAQRFDRNSVSPDKLKALDDCVDATEKLCQAMKELNTADLQKLGIGLAILKGMEYQQENQKK